LPFRLLAGIPTRKGRAPTIQTHLGTLRSGVVDGHVGIDPDSSEIKAAIADGEITAVRILAEPTEPLALARMLVKMGLEIVAAENVEDALEPRFDSARNFARSPIRGTKWWWFMSTGRDALFTKFRRGVTVEEWRRGVSVSVHQFPKFEAVRLQLLDMTIFTALDVRVAPPSMSEYPEPDTRLFEVTC